MGDDVSLAVVVKVLKNHNPSCFGLLDETSGGKLAALFSNLEIGHAMILDEEEFISRRVLQGLKRTFNIPIDHFYHPARSSPDPKEQRPPVEDSQ